MENDVTEKELIIYGSTGKTVVVIGKDNLCIYTMEGLEKKNMGRRKDIQTLRRWNKVSIIKKGRRNQKEHAHRIKFFKMLCSTELLGYNRFS